MVHARLARATFQEFDLTKPYYQTLVREVVFPLLEERPHSIGTTAASLKNAIHNRRVDEENKRRNQQALEEQKQKAAHLPVNETAVIAFGEPLWPVLGEGKKLYNYAELCHAIWYAEYFLGAIAHRLSNRPQDVAITARHLTKYIDPVAPGFGHAVRDVFNAYQANPKGECVWPHVPVNFGH